MEALKKIKKPYLIALISVAVIFILALGSFFYYDNSLKPASDISKKVSFEIVQGDTIDSVIGRLEDQDLIKNATTSKLYAKLNGLNHIKAGMFEIDPSNDTKTILAYLNNSESAKLDESSITFKEGEWAKDMATNIEKSTNVKAADLLVLWNDEAFLKKMMDKYDFLDESILNSEYRVGLEGYLFPETYNFNKKTTGEEITIRMLDEFNRIYNKYKDQFDKSGKSVHEIITMASIIQYEAREKNDMYKISGVFANRLNIDMPLQSSVTVCYALYDQLNSWEDCESNPDIDSPYNTYLHTGLPIGPILNPGEIAIDAALNPQEHDYLYFMADVYGDGSVYYSKTLKEHEALVDKYLRK